MTLMVCHHTKLFVSSKYFNVRQAAAAASNIFRNKMTFYRCFKCSIYIEYLYAVHPYTLHCPFYYGYLSFEQYVKKKYILRAKKEERNRSPWPTIAYSAKPCQHPHTHIFMFRTVKSLYANI